MALTEKEHRVVWLLATGHTRAETARYMGMNDTGLGRYMTRIYQHYDVSSTIELVAKTLVSGDLKLELVDFELSHRIREAGRR